MNENSRLKKLAAMLVRMERRKLAKAHKKARRKAKQAERLAISKSSRNGMMRLAKVRVIDDQTLVSDCPNFMRELADTYRMLYNKRDGL